MSPFIDFSGHQIYVTRKVPGIYEDEKGNMHVMIPELLDRYGLPDTPENRETCMWAAVEAFKEKFPGVPIVEVRE